VDVLIVEDDPGISEPLVTGLQREGFGARAVGTGKEALDASGYDLALVDLGLPDIDGYEVCRRIRARSNVPIILVTARSEEVDRVVGLEIGADDYIVKPFGFRELVARIRAVMRRYNAAPEDKPTALDLGALRIDTRARRVTVNGSEIALTPKEFDLLMILADDPGAVVRRERILDEVWDTNWYGSTKTLDVHIASLRKKLGDPALIETIRGIGFRLHTPGTTGA
jgi:two-component system response regulator RegX3